MFQGTSTEVTVPESSTARESTCGASPRRANSPRKVRAGSTCGVDIKGASIYVTAVPYNQFTIPAEELTGDDGTATLVFRRDANFPASDQQQQLTLFIRATKPGEDPLAGVSTRRLVGIDFSS